MSRRPTDCDTRIELRLPKSLHEAVIHRAKEDRRSVNAELVTLLEQAVAQAEG